MKLTIFKSTAIALILSVPMVVSAAEPIRTSEGLSDPVQAIAQIPITGVRIATGVIAIPLMIVGEIGNISGQAGEALWEQAHRSNSVPMQAADTKVVTNNSDRFL